MLSDRCSRVASATIEYKFKISISFYGGRSKASLVTRELQWATAHKYWEEISIHRSPLSLKF
jgi:hypothetical protein